MASCIHNLDVPTTVAYILGIINILQGLMALLGNLMFFMVIVRNGRLHTRSNACLASLATTDMLVGIILEPLHIMQFFAAEYRNDCGLNSARRFLSTFFMCASIGAITVVSYDRYMHLSKTVNYTQFMTRRKVVALLIISWLVPLMMSMFHFTKEIVLKVFVIVYIFTSIAVMITCYITIIRIVKNREVALKNSSSSIDTSVAKETKTNIRAAKAITLIIAFFFGTFAPMAFFFSVMTISSLSHSVLKISAKAREITYACLATVAMANSAINPIIYYLRIPEFKASFKRYATSFIPGSLQESASGGDLHW
eukprot:Seg2508.2 transcript_id=Seg2508.2/GoldUCD/mRNA.D3Y31 product="Adenosine receptor A3" protein_id=Seg2508.2/GoldUCD/D3Y31